MTGEHSAYTSLSELVELALLNQLELDDSDSSLADPTEKSPEAERALRTTSGRDTAGLLRQPNRDLPVIDPPRDPHAGLSSFTNRLFPLKVCCRVLANMDAPELSAFQETAAEAARDLGLRLKAQDAAMRLQGLDRRWVALPVGDKGRATTDRFINHFSLTVTRAGIAAGPLVALGLAGLTEDGSPRLTSAGASLARAESPVLDSESDDQGVFAGDERAILLSAIADNQFELDAVLRFGQIAQEAKGVQAGIDESLLAETSSPAQATALRASMVGRLHDLGLAESRGSGPDAEVRVDLEPLIALRPEAAS